MKRELRPHQAEAMLRLRQSLSAGKRRPMIQAPTGFGKTLLGCAIVDGAMRKSKRVTFVVPAVSLIDQTVAQFHREGLMDVGVIQAKHPLTNWARPIQVASVQTLERRELPKSDIVVIDEAHKLFQRHKTWMAHPDWQAIPFVGLSATPWAPGLGKFFDDLLIVSTTADLIEAGYLSKFRVFAPSHPDLSGVSIVAGDYHEGQLSTAMSGGTLVADVVQHWLQHGERRPTLCFAVDRAHAKQIEQQFAAAGVPVAYVDAFTKPEDRTKIGEALARGEFQVVVNIGTLTTGVDWDVRCIILARPTKSEMLFTQIIGRGLRTADGKVDCLVFDHSDTHARLGFVTDIHHDTLDDGRERQKAKAKKAPEPRECSQCHFLRPAKMSTCPACGFKAQRQCDVESEDGELLELGAAEKAKADAARVERQRWYSSLLGIAAKRGYKPTWAAANYREKFGGWPDGLSKRPAPEPSPDVVSWVTSKMIAYAKRRHAA